jgi:hypothetical protein
MKGPMNFTTLASEASLTTTISALAKHNYHAVAVDTAEQALTKIKELIPAGSSIMNGSSTTLKEIGFIDLLKNKEHEWQNLHDAIVEESDAEKQQTLREHALFAEYYLGSAHAVTEEGEIVIASNSGSQLPHLVYTSPNIVLVVSTQKITKNISDAFSRIKEHVVPLEDERMKEAYGVGTTYAKTVIMHQESQHSGRNIKIIFVKEKLGF